MVLIRIMRITGAEAVIRALIDAGADTIFGYPGGAIMPVYDALYGYREKIRHILVRHEQGAAHAAEGYARMTGRPGVCMATSGPGATNLVTGIADAMLDSVPIVAVTGQVAGKLLGTDAFQETDVISVTIPLTKWNFQITEAREIAGVVAKAFYIASSGRPGPVLIDVTRNAQTEMVEYHYEPVTYLDTVKVVTQPKAEDLEQAAALINGAHKPYLLVGHGVSVSGAEKEVVELAEKAGIPVASTLLGLSSFPVAHPLYTGMLGMHGNYGPNMLSNNADVVIAVGMRFDDRVTMNLAGYLAKSKLIHIEIDPAEIDKNVKVAVPIVADAKEALRELLKLVQKNSHTEWLEEFRRLNQVEEEKIIKPGSHPQGGKLRMIEAVTQLSEKTQGKAVIVSDVGQHQMMSARYYKFAETNSYVTSGGLGTMGFGLPAAIGCKVGAPSRQVIVIVGDGSFQMTLQELGTIMQEQLPIKIMLLNNSYLGMVRQWQEMFFEGRYSFTGMANPDFIKICESFGIEALRVQDRSELGAGIDKMLAAEKAFLLEVVVDMEENVFPMVPAGHSITDIRLE
ncbi:MAG: biosynthetic-type acetolactate synthase large subunit [Deltaproteobacteria bacterium]|nr:biosynthetic-type acetolactate synthase large subunit [Deltaproteobacteria bacterium]